MPQVGPKSEPPRHEDGAVRELMRMIATQSRGDTDTSRDIEYTDWDDVARWTEAFCAAVPARAPTEAART